MEVFILHSLIKNRNYDGIVLDENDFHPCKPFFIDHPSLKPESIEHITIKGVLEQHKYLRTVLRYCDYMLAPGGTLDIYFYNAHFDVPGLAVRGRNEWQYELSLVFQDRIILLENEKTDINGHFVYKKIDSCLPDGDTIERWSFGIVSDGRRNDRILEIIHQVEAFNIQEFEVLVCGPAPSEVLPEHVIVIDDSPFYSDKRIPISKKKNAIIRTAKYNNLILMHDRISFSREWYDKMKAYGNYYDCLCSRIVMDDTCDNRMNDWSVPNSFHTTLWEKLKPRKIVLEYDDWSPEIYVSGGFMQIKKHFAQSVQLNPNLYWGEMEDVDFSQRLYQSGVLVSFYKDNLLYSEARRFTGLKKRTHTIFGLRVILGKYRRYIEERKAFDSYLNNL